MWKFQYLKSLLEGSAVNAIFGLPLTNSNYKEAVVTKKLLSLNIWILYYSCRL